MFLRYSFLPNGFMACCKALHAGTVGNGTVLPGPLLYKKVRIRRGNAKKAEPFGPAFDNGKTAMW